ncbi:MAG TPA: division/cell wall cluster transcriptional repressor MraZ [Candidatus Staskawiczbacteria bacterium]|nr:division/cell wall cluster transcriptional repressor MraZ [Candidatus Staskawiczbacteria bacterium]
MLIGQHEHTIDTKNRMALPAKFRGELGDSVIITSGVDGCLSVFTQESWKEESSRWNNSTIASVEERSVARVMLGNAAEVLLDKLGRILLPDYLKKIAGLDKNVVICGLLNRLEIWDKSKWQEYSKNAEKEVENMVSKLGNLGI